MAILEMAETFFQARQETEVLEKMPEHHQAGERGESLALEGKSWDGSEVADDCAFIIFHERRLLYSFVVSRQTII
jgi:hypothetical protein